MSKFKKEKLKQALTEEKQTCFRLRKKGKRFVTVSMLVLTVGGTAAGLVQADGLKLCNTFARSLPKPPTSGTVNYQYSGTGNVLWSDGHKTSANFMKVNGQTDFLFGSIYGCF